MGYTGLYKDPSVGTAAFLVPVTLLEVVGLIWGLRQTAREGRSYGGQILAGTMMAVIAGVIIMASSLLFTTVLFPNYAEELQNAYRATLVKQGKSDAEILTAIQAAAASWTPMAQAMSGFIGTLVTGIVASGVIGYYVRKR